MTTPRTTVNMNHPSWARIIPMSATDSIFPHITLQMPTGVSLILKKHLLKELFFN